MSTQNTRLLAAVMFTDIVGYTSMMQEDEAYANQQRDRHRSVLEEKATHYGGEILHYYGDGAITIFNSAFNAVTCAIKIQQEFNKPYLPLRIGIHTGDIAYSKEEVYGNAVNIASRLEGLATAGAILISEKVLDEVQNHQTIHTASLGSFKLKNVKQPVPVFAISNFGIAVPSSDELKSKHPGSSSRVAVLPFVNMSNEDTLNSFSDGLSEEIINGLTKIEGLSVISRTSAFAYKNHNTDIRQIGEKLSVSHILEGSVRKHGDTIRITAQLIETEEGSHLWSETYDRALENIFDIQDAISDEILLKFQETVLTDGQKDFAENQNNKAYRHFLEGRFQWEKWNFTSVQKALQSYKQAVEFDSSFAEAYADLANCYTYLGFMGQMSPRLAFKKAEAAAEKAVTLNDAICKSYVAMANVKTFYHRSYSKSNVLFKEASLVCAEDYASFFYYYSIFLNVAGKHDLAIKWVQKALQIDPINFMYNAELGRAYFFSHRFQDALEQYNYTLELDSSFLSALIGKGWVLVMMNELKKAHDTFEIYQNLVSDKQKNTPQLIYLAARMGAKDTAVHFLDSLQLGYGQDSYKATSMDFALINLGLQRYDEVFFHLQRAEDDYLGKLLFLPSNPVWDEIKSDERYDSLIASLGLSEINYSIRPISL